MNWLRNRKKVRTNILPNWYGIEGIGYEFRGVWSDPLLHYKGRTFYTDDIHDGLWWNYVEDGGNPDNECDWVAYVIDNAVDYLEDIIFATESE